MTRRHTSARGILLTEQGKHPGSDQSGRGQTEVEHSLLADLLERSRLYHTSKDYLADHVKANVTVGSFDFCLLTKAAGQVETALGIAARTLFERRI